MSSDPRRTGGAANRGWCDGIPMHEPPPDRDYLAAQLAAYLSDCARFAPMLRSDDHPTILGALKVIPHRTERDAAAIRRLYRQAAGL